MLPLLPREVSVAGPVRPIRDIGLPGRDTVWDEPGRVDWGLFFQTRPLEQRCFPGDLPLQTVACSARTTTPRIRFARFAFE
jgi:hypothetical protein